MRSNRSPFAANSCCSFERRKRDALARLASTRRARFEGAAGRLRPAPLNQRITRGADALVALHARAVRAMAGRLAHGRQKLEARAQMLSALSYQGILARGFAIVRDGNGAMVRSAASVVAGAALGVEFQDGEVRVQAIENGAKGRTSDKAPVATLRPAKAKGGSHGGAAGGQGTLF